VVFGVLLGKDGYTGGSSSSLPPVDGIAGSPLLRAIVCFGLVIHLLLLYKPKELYQKALPGP
jgi:hypothetical protein